MPLNFSSLFPPAREINVNYAWTDLNSGTGYISYDGLCCEMNGGNKYHLVATNQAYYTIGTKGKLSTYTGYTITGAYTKMQDIDFDGSIFQTDQILRGTGIVRIGWSLYNSAAGAASCYFIIRIRKWDGVTETEIASCQSKEKAWSAGTPINGHTINIDIPETKIKKNELLRITVEQWAKKTAGTWGCQFWHDPRDPTGNEKLVFIVPFKLQV